MNKATEILDWELGEGVCIEPDSTDLSQFDLVLVSEPDDDWFGLYSRSQPACYRLRGKITAAIEATYKVDNWGGDFIHFGLPADTRGALFEDLISEYRFEYVKIIGPSYISVAEDTENYCQNCLRWILTGKASMTESPLRIGVIGGVFHDNVILLANLAKSYLGERAAQVTIMRKLCL